MGFDNECILNIQSLPGEYFCPVCRTLVYPNEALQTQCTHLYCKPCLAYIVATTQGCPYDGYLVTEADSKPLMESNKSLSDSIGKVTVHCLYHKSGCQWQGKLSDCITHGTTCAYGNSPVVCNRCGTQIVHRQVQEHAQLCPGLQPQAQQADSSLTQSSAATTQAVSQDPSAVASAAPAAAVTAVTTSAVETSSAVATTASTTAVSLFLAAAPTAASQGQAVAPQTPTAEQYQQQLQYQQYYQQHYPGYNPYIQQYQQYCQYQQYTQLQMQVAPQNVAQAPAQPAPYVQPEVLQPSQPQHVLPSQPQNQPHLPQLQAPVVQPQPQQNQPLQSTPQISQMQPQSQVPLQLPHPQAQPMAHPPAPTQVGSQPFAMPAAQATTPQVQPHVQPHPPQQQQVVAQQHHLQMQHLPQQQHLQPQIQLNSQIQHQHPQVQQQSYPQPQVYHQPHPMPHAQPQNPSVHVVTGHQSYPQPQPAQQMPQGAPLQRPVHASHQQVVGPQHPALVRPPQGQFPLQGQQPALLAPQGTQHTPQHQQHVGHHAPRPQMNPSIPSQAPQQGFPLNKTVPSQTGQLYQQGMSSSQQQQMHSQPFQSHGPPFMQQHHVQTSAVRSMSCVAPPPLFQNQPSRPLKDLQASVMNQQAPMHRASDTVGVTSELHGAGQPIGQGSSSLETHASESGKSENATNATGNTEVSDNKNGGIESTVVKPTMSSQASIALDGADGLDNVKGKDEFSGWQSNLHGPNVRGDKESKASGTSNNIEKGGSLQQASQQNLGALGSNVPPGMGPQHPSGPDRMLPQHMLHPGSMPYMQGQLNQMRPPKHSFPKNIRPPMQQQPYGSYDSEMAPRAPAPNQTQMPIPQPATIRPNDGIIWPPMGGPLPGQRDTAVPPFAPEHLGRPHPLGMAKSNGVGGGPLGSSGVFHEEGFNSSREHFRSFAAYPSRHNVNRKDIEENMKQFPGPTHLDGEGLQRGPRPFEGGIGRPDGFADSLPGRPPFPNQPGAYPIGYPEYFARKPHSTFSCPDFVSPGVEFGHHRIDGMPTFRNPGPFLQGMAGGPGGFHKDQLGSGNLCGIVQHDFDSPEFPHTHLHPGDTFVPRNLHGGGEPLGHGQLHAIEPSGYSYHGHMHPDDPNHVIDYSQHGFPKESGHFGSGGHLRNGDVGWCRICKFSCGSAEGLDLHVQTREHQQYAMDIVLKMKHDVAKRQKMNSGGPKSFNKKVGGKGNFHGNKR